jgi:hypothetical protein
MQSVEHRQQEVLVELDVNWKHPQMPRTDGVVLVHNAVVEDAEADGDASLASLCCGD